MIIKYLKISAIMLSLMTLSCSDKNSNVTGSNDDTPPAIITDLSTGNPTGSSVTLNWTSPGDDNNMGKAKVYDIRYASFIITDNNFASATQVSNVPSPMVAGESESFSVNGLASNSTFYFAMRTADEVPNWSGLSNIDSATTLLSGSWLVYNTTNSGLPSDTIFDIALPGTNKYFGTTAGLVKFDGTDWKVYDTLNSNIAGNYINTVLVALSSQNIWIGTQNNGASLFDGTTFTNYTVDSSGPFVNDSNSGLTVNAIRSIALKGYDIWFGTSSGGGICRLMDTTIANYWLYYNSFTTNIINNSIISMAFDNSGKLWVATNVGGVSRLDNDFSFTNYNEIAGYPFNVVWTIVSDNFGNVWFGTDKGVSKYNGNSFDTTYNVTNSGLIDNVVISIAIDLSGNKWFGTRFGLSRFDGSNWITYTTENSGLPDNFINVIEIDMVGNLWLGTNNGTAKFTE